MSEQKSFELGTKAFDLGAKIKKARESSGKELEVIAVEICVSKSYLIAIEKGDFDALPALPFAIGFIRSFVREIGLDASVITAEFKEIVRPPVVEDDTPEHKADRAEVSVKAASVKRGPIYGGMAVALSAISAVWMIFAGGQQAAYVQSSPDGKNNNFAESIIQDTQGKSSQVTQSENKDDIAETKTVIEKGFAPAANQFMGVANAADAAADEVMMQQVTEVMFEARQDAWVRISSGDDVLFEGVLHAGDHYVPPMGPKLNLTTSNAGGLALHIGEHDLGVLGAKGSIIKNVKIDPDSLILRLVETL